MATSLADLSVKRPIFITCIIISMLAVGYLSYKKLPVDLFPNVAFPVVMVNTTYPGAGPEEIEILISKVLEDEFSSVPGIKSLSSASRDSLSTVVAEFSLETDIKNAETQIRDRISSAKRRLPQDIKEPMVRRLDPANQPILTLSIDADLPPGKLFEIADEEVRPKIEQVNKVGLVQVLGGRKREIHVEIDQKKLRAFELSASGVSERIAASGQNIPVGKHEDKHKEEVYRTLGEFKSLDDIGSTIVNFLGNDVPVTVSQIGKVVDTLADENSRTFVNGEKTIFLMVFKQSGANTIEVAKNVKKRVEDLNKMFGTRGDKTKITVVRDGSRMVEANVDDVQESILLGILLTVMVVYLFLGSARSTIITGLALPNSLLGAFILMAIAGFTINVMTLLALSLCVGLLVDDAIVVRENIFRHRHNGVEAIKAAVTGTKEVTLAVIATSLTVIAVFLPIGFLQGVVGQFFKEFGLTICFAMAISLFDALTIAPMLSAYFAPSVKQTRSKWFEKTIGLPVIAFEKLQIALEKIYEKVLYVCLRLPILVLVGAFLLFVGSIFLTKFIPKTFLSPQDTGEFAVSIELEPGASLEAMFEVAQKVDALLRSNPEVKTSVMTVGNRNGESNFTDYYVNLVDAKKRKVNTSEFKDHLRKQLKEFAFAKPKVKEIDMVGGGMRPFSMNIIGHDFAQLEDISNKVFAKLKDHPGLTDVDLSQRSGKPEIQVAIDREKAERLGVATNVLGNELRTLIEGSTPAVFRQGGREFDLRVRLQEDQRNLKTAFDHTYVPNINYRMVKLANVAKLVETTGPSIINRQERGRYIQIGADIATKGPGLNKVLDDIDTMFKKEIELPPGMRYTFVGQAESFGELKENMFLAVILSVLFIYLVLASLYESFVTPFTIMLVLPLAICGAFVGLLVTGKALDLNSMIGCILLMGIATKNSILLVDYANQKIEEGKDRREAILLAGKTRLRPILMTTVALIAGMLPIAIGLNEASKQRTTMGVAVIGGLISSTLLSLIVVPAAFSYIDRFRVWSGSWMKRLFVKA